MKKKYILNYIIYTILQLTWGIIQNILGIILFTILSIINIKRKRFYYHGAIGSDWKFSFSMGLGMFIFYGHRNREDMNPNEVLVHEYGHTIQSIILGPLFFFVIALPSVIWAFTPAFVKMRKEKGIKYTDVYCESWANVLGEKVLKEKATWL